jgi:hypothetical protein
MGLAKKMSHHWTHLSASVQIKAGDFYLSASFDCGTAIANPKRNDFWLEIAKVRR